MQLPALQSSQTGLQNLCSIMSFRQRLLVSLKNLPNTSSMSSAAATVTMDNMNPCIKKMEYAVRGPLVIRATAIEKEIQAGVKKPFPNVIKANIGDAHAMGNKPITFIRQVLAIVTHPPLLESPDLPEDAKTRARAILEGCKGGSVGSYSDSPGLEIIRRHVAEYIKQRDGGIESDWQKIILCAGASEVSADNIDTPTGTDVDHNHQYQHQLMNQHCH